MPVRLVAHVEAEGASRVSVPGAWLLADVTGFTPLANRLGVRFGAAGAERLSRTLNGLFGRLLPIVRDEGGEVSKFAGDAMLVWFPTSGGRDLAEAARAAARCAGAMLDVLAVMEPVEGETPSLRVAIAAADAHAIPVGGHRDAWDLALVGPAIGQLGDVWPASRRGTAVVAPSAEGLLPDLVRREHGSAWLDLGAVQAAREAETTPAKAPSVPPSDVRRWLPSPLRTRLDSRLDDWLAELRVVTPVFVTFPDLDVLRVDAALLARVVRVAQEELDAHHGQLLEVATDDKGLYLTAGFGLPGAVVERPSEYAVVCALRVHARLAAEGVRARVGVTTGRFFIGPVGDAFRREIALLGPAMNLAARFAFRGDDGVLVDEPTRTLAARAAVFADLPPKRLKGFDAPVPVWRAVEARSARLGEAGSLAGRRVELDELDALLAGHARGEAVACTLEGPAGIGKSRLVAHVVADAQTRGALVLHALGDAAAADRPWHAWEPAFETLLGVSRRDPRERRVAALRAALSEVPHGEERAPLLAPALGVELPDTAETERLVGNARARSAAALFAALAARRAGADGAVLVVDDAQWLDEASADALAPLREALAPAFVLAAIRTGDTAPAAALDALVASPGTRRIAVRGLDVDAAAELIAATAGVASCPPALAAWVCERARGNPFFMGELATALGAQGLVRVEGGAVAEVDFTALDRVAPTMTVETLVGRRVDALTPDAQLALKAASALGMQFTAGDLGAVHPSGPEAVAGALRELRAASLCEPVEGDGWTFGHRITCDVAYSLMLDEQRTRLHGSIARHLQASGDDDPAALAWHWERAGDVAQALRWLDASCRKADRAGALAEAHAAAARAVALLESPDAPPHRPVERARWWRWMAEIDAGRGRYPDVIAAGGRAVAALGHPLPVSSGAWRERLARGVLTQVLQRLRPPATRDDREAAEEALALNRAAEGFYFTQSDRLVALACFLDAVNLSERAGVMGQTTNAWGVMSVALTGLGAERAGRFYLDRAMRNAEAGGDGRELGYAYFHAASVASVRHDWDAAARLFEVSAEWCMRSGSNFMLNNTWSAAGVDAFHRGRVGEALALAERLGALPTFEKTERGRNIEASLRAAVALLRGDDATAASFAERARDALRRVEDTTWTRAAGIHARALLGLGRVADARDEVSRILPDLAGSRPVDLRRLEAYASPAEVVTALRCEDPADPSLGALHATADATLARFARTFRIGEARLHLLRGADALGHGRRDAARRHLVRAVRAADASGMETEGSRARRMLGALGAAGDDDARRAERWMRREGVRADLDAAFLRRARRS